MDITYRKLFKLLIDRKMKKKDLQTIANISPTTMAKLSKDENVSLEIIVRICKALNVDVGDILEVII